MSKRGADDLLTSPVTEQSVVKRMDTKLSPNKDEGLTDIERNAVIMKVKETAPDWYVQAFSFILKELSIIKNEAKSVERIEKETKKTNF